MFPLGLALSLLATCSLADEHERRLYKKLFSDYSIYERPVLNHTHAVFVRFQIVLNQLVDVVSRFCNLPHFTMDRQLCFQDEKNQTILMNVWFKYVGRVLVSNQSFRNFHCFRNGQTRICCGSHRIMVVLTIWVYHLELYGSCWFDSKGLPKTLSLTGNRTYFCTIGKDISPAAQEAGDYLDRGSKF